MITIFLKTIWYYINSLVHYNTEARRNYSRIFYLNYYKYFKYNLKYNRGAYPEIDAFIPVIERDLETLKLTIPSLRLFSLNPIKNIFIVAPKSTILEQFAKETNCIFVDEKSILNIEFQYNVNGQERSNWLYQQLLKLSWDKVSSSKYCLVFDSDTILVRKHSFIDNGIINFICSEEYHQPYFLAYSRLLKKRNSLPLSFIGHYMLFEKDAICHLKKVIEVSNNESWIASIFKSIDFNELCGFSEYETYGHFFYENFKNKMRINYFNNISLKRDEIDTLNLLIAKYSVEYATISFHHHS